VAYYHRARIGHVEAGLRTGDRLQPYPEEINRRITDLLADLYFAPTELNRQNLLREGVPDHAIVLTGNTIVDALHMTVQRLNGAHAFAGDRTGHSQRLILVTAHRRENFGYPLVQICKALAEIAQRFRSRVRIVYPVHPNPNVLGTVRRMLSGIPNIVLTEPLGYREFVQLMSQAHLILTDSGGLQEEAPSLGIPALVLRDVTERPEGVAAGVVRLVGTDTDAIVAAVTDLLENPAAYNRMAQSVNPYGDGRASQRIVQAICEASHLRPDCDPISLAVDERLLDPVVRLQ
jgi:UDP-N-acetylglucosamine 2-epimerase (non-hydrolysing)